MNFNSLSAFSKVTGNSHSGVANDSVYSVTLYMATAIHYSTVLTQTHNLTWVI